MRFHTEIRVHTLVTTNSDPCSHHLFLMCSPERWEASPKFYRPVNTEPSPHSPAHGQGAGIATAVISTHCLPSSVLDTPRACHSFSASLLIGTFMILALQIRTGVRKLPSLGPTRQPPVLVTACLGNTAALTRPFVVYGCSCAAVVWVNRCYGDLSDSY